MHLSILQKERERLILWMPVLMGLGIALYFRLAAEPWPWAGAAALTVSVSLAAALYRLRNAWWLLLAAFGIPALGFTAAQLRVAGMETPLLKAEVKHRQVEGRIADIVLGHAGERKIVLDAPSIEGIDGHGTPRRIRVNLRASEEAALAIGDEVALKATLLPLPAPAMPRAFDFARHLYFEGLGATGYATGKVEVKAHGRTSAFFDTLEALRLSMAEAMLSCMGEEEGAVAAAITVGVQTAVPEGLSESMRDSGLYHILSISGLHLALASGIVFFSVRLLLCLSMSLGLRLPVKKIAASAALLCATFYLLIAGYPVPAQRSYVMVAFVLLAVLFDRRGISLYALAWAAMLILLFRPESFLSASFQLSFAATLAIVALHERYGRIVAFRDAPWLSRIPLYFLAVALTSLVAALATTPFVLYHFNRLQLWGMLANMLVSPLASFWIMPGVVLTFLLWPLGLEGIGFTVMETGIRAMVAVSHWMAALPHARILLPRLSDAGFTLAALGLLWMCLWRSRVRLFGAAAIVLGISTMALYRPPLLLVSGDARQALLRQEDGSYALMKGSARGFTVQAWLSRLAQEKASAVDCAEEVCHVSRQGKRIAVITHWRGARQACAEANVDAVVALAYLRDHECPDVPLRIDRAALASKGALALYTEGGELKAEYAADTRGKRPWVP